MIRARPNKVGGQNQGLGPAKSVCLSAQGFLGSARRKRGSDSLAEASRPFTPDTASQTNRSAGG